MQILPNDVKSTLLNCISEMASNSWQFTTQPCAFTCTRKISFEDVLLSVISMQKSSSRHEYAAMCDMIGHYSAVSDQKAIFIADRGFVSFNVFAYAIENGTYFLIRARDTGFHNLLSTLQLPDTEEFDLMFERWITRRNTKTVKVEPEIYKSIAGRVFDYLEPKSKKLYYISFRIVRFLLPNGDTETIYTNLPKEEFSADELRHLYHLR